MLKVPTSGVIRRLLTPAHSRARGRKTRRLGASQRHAAWPSAPSARLHYRAAFFCGHGCRSLCVPSCLSSPAYRTCFDRSWWTADICWGEKQLTIYFGGQQFQWIFLLSDICFPILGADFLRHFNLVVDLEWKCIFGGDSNLLASVQAAPFSFRSLLVSFRMLPILVAARFQGRPPSWSSPSWRRRGSFSDPVAAG
jgi:hypothetical protein